MRLTLQALAVLLPPKRPDLPEEEGILVDDLTATPGNLATFGRNEATRAPEEDTYDHPADEPNVQCAQQ